jgi:hypothetical protein
MIMAVALMITVGAYFAVIDLMIASAHYHHRDDWDREGMPRGYYWRPPDVPVSGGMEALRDVCWRWLLRTPSWAADGNQNFRILLRAYRVLTLVVFVGWIAGMYLFLRTGR